MMCVKYLLINTKDTILDMFNIIASNAESDYDSIGRRSSCRWSCRLNKYVH